jgi:hypothetical protein
MPGFLNITLTTPLFTAGNRGTVQRTLVIEKIIV